jgi:hypothetical protein
MESLSEDDISQGVLNRLRDLMRNNKSDKNFNLPALKQIIVTRWSSDKNSLGSYSYRETDSDVLKISHSDLSEPLYDDEDVPRYS